MSPQPPLLRLRTASLCLILAGVGAANPFTAGAEAPCDSTKAGEPEVQSLVQIGFRAEVHGDTCLYVYSVLNRSRDTLTAVQIGYDVRRELCELTGAPPHAPPDTAYSPPGWECGPLQSEDPKTFTLGWKLASGLVDRGGIPPDTLISGFRVALPQPDSLYERCHWLVRFKAMPKAAYAGRLRPEGELDVVHPGTGTISGKVTDARGKGIPYPSIFVKRATLGSVSRSDGTYLIAKAPAETSTLVARTMGYDPCETAHVRVIADDTTRVDFVLSTAQPSTPCTPYVTARDRLEVPFPGDVVDTLGARFLDRRTRVPSRQAGDTSAPRAFIYSLTSGDVEVVYRGLGQDTLGRAFVASVHRNFRTSEEEHLIRIAEETYPPPEAILAIAGSRSSGPALSSEKRLWWYDDFDGVRLPYAVTLDAVRYYLGLLQAMGRGDSAQTNRIRMKRGEFSYYANISPRPRTFSRDGRVFRDVYVVEMGLSWSNYCGPECACWFSLDRTVVLRRDGTVLCVFGDRKPSVTVS